MLTDDALNIHWSEISELEKVKASATILNPYTGQSNPSKAESTLTFEIIEHIKNEGTTLKTVEMFSIRMNNWIAERIFWIIGHP